MSKEVLFVEDDDDLRTLFALALRAANFTVIEAAAAQVAIDVVERKTPDVILLDMFMAPGEMSGIELLARLREHVGWASIPVVVLSGYSDVVNRDLMMRLGVRAVLLKGAASPSDVIRAIQDALGS